MSGPARRPAAQNRLNGNPGKRGRAVQEPQFPSGEPVCPDWIDIRAAEHWDYAIEMMRAVPGMVTMAERDLLIQYATTWDDFYRASDIVEKQGMLIVNEKTGVARKNPAVEIKFLARADILRMEKLMGFDPSSRSGKQFGSGADEVDPLQELMRRRESEN